MSLVFFLKVITEVLTSSKPKYDKESTVIRINAGELVKSLGLDLKASARNKASTNNGTGSTNLITMTN